MIQRAFSRVSAGAVAATVALAVIASITLLYSCQAAKAQEKDQIAEAYVLRAGDVETVFRVLADQVGIVPSDEMPFEDVLEEVKKTGLNIARSNKDEQFIVVQTSGSARTYAAMQEQASKLIATTGAAVRWAGPIVLTGEALNGNTADTRELLLPTNVVIAKVSKDIDEEAVKGIADRLGLRFLQRNPADDREYYFESPPEKTDVNVFTASRALLGLGMFEYAVPNFLMVVELRQSLNDEFLDEQWSLNNTGQYGGVVDADIDADRAWDEFGLGKAGTVIAVVDTGFDMAHLDLIQNLKVNLAENAKNNIDDDGNGYIDDRSGWDFTSICWGNPVPGCGDADPTGADTKEGRHGTMTAGAAAATGDNVRGVTGSCPNCELLPLKIRTLWVSSAEQTLAFAYAQVAGADIITNSWGYRLRGLVTLPIENAINSASAAGAVIFFAMSTTGEGGYENDCVAKPPFTQDISSLDSVIAVSASNNADTRTPAGYGNCMEVLAPTDNEQAGTGTLWPVSTDITGARGYNSDNPIMACASSEFASPPVDNLSYTFCAGGTSYAAPLTAGVAGLLKSLDDTLTPLRLKQVLQDTADKIEPGLAAYDSNAGFSTPTMAPTPQRSGSPGGVGSTHGFGRVNAYEAARLVAPTAAGGRGDIDLFLRDNRVDWGNTEQPSNLLMDNSRAVIPYASVSIKIDAPDYESAPPTTPQEFAAFPNEDPRAEATNKVYVLVRNRGRNDATNVVVKLLWAFAGTSLPDLPGGFWNAFPADPTNTAPWTVVDTKTIQRVGYSGASIATQAGDEAQIVTFDFVAPALDSSMAEFRDYCLFAVIDSSEDPVSRGNLHPDEITPNDNNITMREVSLRDPPS
jgi:hypothetical protein